MDRRNATSTLARRSGVLLVAALATSFVWVFTAIDDYVVHLPYAWGHSCGPCYEYYNGMYATIGDPGAVAAAFFFVSLTLLTLLWVPAHGVWRAAARSFLLVAPASLFLFELGTYFLLNYWWSIHATNFLTSTPITNEVVFWVSMAVLVAGVAVNAAARR